MTNREIYQKLDQMADSRVAAFTKRLSPDTKYGILGVTVPKLRALAKEIAGAENVQNFFDGARLEYYEDILLYGFAAGAGKPTADEVFDRIDFLIPHMDTWSQTDTILFPAVMRKDAERTIEHYLPFQKAPDYIKQRIFGLAVMQLYARKFGTVPRAIEYLKGIPATQYYSQMIVAWTLADAAAANYGAVLAELKAQTFSPWIHNKAIQKSRESRRITEEQKAEMKALKR